jgi:CHAD domain-containing protein
VTRWFAPRQARARADSLDALYSARHLALLEALDGLLAHPPVLPAAGRRADAVLRRELTHAHRRVDRHLRAAAAPGAGRDAELHEARKAGKRLRYATEAAGPAVGGTRALVKRTKALQDLLGEHQDAVVAAPVLRELAIAAHGAGENGYPFGLLAGRALGRGMDERALAAAPAAVRKATNALRPTK